MSKKLIVAAIVAVMAVGASIAQATPSRVQTLGATPLGHQGGVYIADDTNIFWNPATLGKNGKLVLLHLGAADGGDIYAYGGVSLGLGDTLLLGIVAGRHPDKEEGPLSLLTGAGGGGLLVSGGAPNTGTVGTNSTFNINFDGTEFAGVGGYTLPAYQDDTMDWMNPLDLILAAKLGGLNVGVSYYYANGKFSSTDENDDNPLTAGANEAMENSMDAKASLHSIKVGIAAEGDVAPELWFHYDRFKVNSKWEMKSDTNADLILDTTEEEQEALGRRINLGGRVFFKMSDSVTLVPAIEWVNTKGERSFDLTPDVFIMTDLVAYPTVSEEDMSELYKGNIVSAGLGINYTQDRLLVASSIGLAWAKGVGTLEIDGVDGEYEATMKSLSIPTLTLGVEYQATKVLVIRSGIATTTLVSNLSQDMETSVNNELDATQEAKASQQVTTAAAGIGLHFGNLVVDLTAGGDLITAEPGSPALFSGMDVKYTF